MSESLPICYEPNFADFLRSPVKSITSTDTNASELPNIFDRKNTSAFVSNKSIDTTIISEAVSIIITLAYPRSIDTILMIGNNFRAYRIRYKSTESQASWTDLLNELDDVNPNKTLSFTAREMQVINLIVFKTDLQNKHKFINQLILTKRIGQFNLPCIKSLEFTYNDQITRSLTGRSHIAPKTQTFRCQIGYPYTKDQGDCDLLQRLYEEYKDGFLFYPSGGLESQFAVQNQRGYRGGDIYLVSATGSKNQSYNKGIYQSTLSPSLDLLEVI